MKLLATLTSGVEKKGPDSDNTLRPRTAVRIVLFNDRKQIALLRSSKGNHLKLPGGGVENGESLMQALHREVSEEVGFTCEIMVEVGYIHEYRWDEKLDQISYCYIGHILRDLGQRALTDEEIRHGHDLDWLTPDEAITQMESFKSDDLTHVIMTNRDKLFISTSQTLISV